MNNYLKQISVLALLCCSFLFISCETEETITTETVPTEQAQPALVTIDEVLSKINSSEIKNTIKNLTNPNLKSRLNDFENAEYFEKVGVKDKFHQYTLYLNGYTPDRPYFLYYIITVDIDLKEKSGFLKYIPDQPISVLDATKFSGKLKLLNNDMDFQAEIVFNQGQAVPMVIGTTICVENVIVNVHNCSNGGEHAPGESCAPGYVNDAYYSLVDIVETCWTEFDYTSPGTFIGGGGGSSMSNIDRFNNRLTAQQTAFLNANPTVKNIIYDFIEHTAILSSATLMVDLGMRDVSLLTPLLNHLKDKNFSQNSTRFVSWAVDYLIDNPNVTALQFDNWFMGEVEGVESTEPYVDGYWDNPNLIIPQQQLPTKAAFLAAYPQMPTSQLCSLIGGDVLTLYNAIIATGKPMNSCTVRLSRALNYSGINIPNIPGKTKLGGDGNYYFTFASDITAWMIFTFGISNSSGGLIPYNSNHMYLDDGGANGTNFVTQLENTTGIYAMQPISVEAFQASGHCDALVDGLCLTNFCFFGNAFAIHVWVLN
ncbi:T6SS effector amidase Tae4 family protein [Flavobacterium litorale]|uniref:Type VI secretion system amidase effector protein Tae4 n=1 Tax=Flavobacterium litorale TaxID=2856519 RepID=A0ABX8V3N2_9FLAO|nr:T6SS effector amidase Tae4 family protein [Flavobacterium litorale]QYJ67377.1 type VI secretion system amidase effector protein Tae4 [Flavobacterium litorale]